MKKLSDLIKSNDDITDYLLEVLNNKLIVDFIQENQIPKAIYEKNISKFITYLSDSNKYKLVYENYNIYLIEKMNRPPRTTLLSEIDFDNVEIMEVDNNKREAFEYFNKILTEHAKGMFLSGKRGIGKTYVFKRFAKRLKNDYDQVIFIKYATFIQEIKSHIKTNDYMAIVDEIKHIDCLLIDDFDKSGLTNTWLCNEILYNIFDYRAEHHKLTFINSNYRVKQLVEESTDIDAGRVIERIRMCTHEIYMLGKSYRKY